MKEFEMWTDGTIYRDTVRDNRTGEFRCITAVEDAIVEFCFCSPDRWWSDACEELSYNRFESEPYNSKDLEEAAVAIWEHISTWNIKRCKAKPTIYLMYHLADYVAENAAMRDASTVNA